MNDLWYQLFSVLQVNAGGGDFVRMYGICSTIFKKKRNKCATGVDQIRDDYQVYHNEYDCSAPHHGLFSRGAPGMKK
jgi:hypothetical protein